MGKFHGIKEPQKHAGDFWACDKDGMFVVFFILFLLFFCSTFLLLLLLCEGFSWGSLGGVVLMAC